MVGLEETSPINVTEGGTVEVCVVVREPQLPCPITFTFDVIIEVDGMYIIIPQHTQDKIYFASYIYTYQHWFLGVGISLSFDSGSTDCPLRQCSNLTFEDDGSVEMDERIILSLVDTTHEQILLDGVTRSLNIRDNDGNNNFQLCILNTSMNKTM